MKKITALILSLIAVFALASCSGSDAPSGMKLASNEVCDYYFYVPTNWTVDMSTGVTSAYYSEKDRSNISMTSYALSGEMTADSYWESIRSTYAALFAEMSEPEVKTTALDGVEAKQRRVPSSSRSCRYSALRVRPFTYSPSPLLPKSLRSI